MVNDVSAASGISSHEQVVNSITKQSFRLNYVKMTFISKFSFFSSVFKRDFIKHADFTCISASNTASDDVTN